MGSSRKASSDTVRSDSLRTSVTEQTTYAPVPKRTADLKVSAAQWTQLRSLPEGFGLAVRSDGMSLSLTSDGQGGVSVTAEADSIGRRVAYRREEAAHRTRDETLEKETEKREPSCWRLVMPALALLGILLFGILIRRHLKTH